MPTFSAIKADCRDVLSPRWEEERPREELYASLDVAESNGPAMLAGQEAPTNLQAHAGTVVEVAVKEHLQMPGNKAANVDGTAPTNLQAHAGNVVEVSVKEHLQMPGNKVANVDGTAPTNLQAHAGTAVEVSVKEHLQKPGNKAANVDGTAGTVRPSPKSYKQVTVFRSRQDTPHEYFNLMGSFELQNDGIAGEKAPSVLVCPDHQVSKPWLGFGGAFTEASCLTLDKLSDSKRDEILRAYFDVELGLGYNLARIHIGSCDFSSRSWTCGEISSSDRDLSGFSIKRYKKGILPMISKAVKIAKKPLDILATPWTPIPWMKTGQKFNSGALKRECWGTWAKHYVRFIQEFRQAGVPIWAVSVQNEPTNDSGRWESCTWTAADERDFVRDHLGPALAEAGLESVRILVWDDNRDGMLERCATIYRDPEAAKYVWGAAYHWYGDPRFDAWAEPWTVQFSPSPGQACYEVRGQACFENVRRVAELRPDKHILFTEGCQELGDTEMGSRLDDWKVGEKYGMNIIADMNAGCEGWIDWNLCLDNRGGPNHNRNFCIAPFIVDREEILPQPCYWFLLHFARFIRPGARRVVCSSNRDVLEVTAWINPGDQGAPGTTADNVAVVVMNQSDQDTEFWLKVIGDGAVQFVATAHSIHTLVIECAPASS